MTTEEAQLLIQKYNAGTASIAEKNLLENWYAQQREPLAEKEIDSARNEVWARIQTLQPVTKVVPLWKKITVAASVLLVATAGVYYLQTKDRVETVAVEHRDIAPGGNKAILTLANGQKLVLNGAQNGSLARQQGLNIRKLSDGNINYSGQANTSLAAMNTITTPNGGIYAVTLSDGTIATLDAGSSVTYPVFFTGKERRVRMTGQVYFSVKHNAAQPFLVTVNGQTIRDIGTEFNIKAYKSVTTTLVSGAVQLEKDNQRLLLKPGQQAENLTLNKQSDAEEATAWKNGFFKFRESVPEIMDKISRWYDIDVTYSTKPNNEQYFGKVDRKRNISAVLAMMEASGIHFKIEGRRITVMP